LRDAIASPHGRYAFAIVNTLKEKKRKMHAVLYLVVAARFPTNQLSNSPDKDVQKASSRCHPGNARQPNSLVNSPTLPKLDAANLCRVNAYWALCSSRNRYAGKTGAALQLEYQL
jgi:hypothetical protein